MQNLQNSTLLASFIAVVETQSFTFAAKRLALRQSTVSQHIRKLEEAVGRRLLVRDTHSVKLTTDGEAMVDFAKTILDAHASMHRYFVASERRDRVRLGVSEDLVLSSLFKVLDEFSVRHPFVDLELTVGLSSALYNQLSAGQLDLLFAKRIPGDDRGELMWREHLVWVARKGFEVDPQRPVPLIVFPLPSITRAVAVRAMEQAGRSWRIACTSSSLTGIWAGALAGLGLTAQSGTLLPDGLARVADAALPELGIVEFVVVHGNARVSRTVEALTSIIKDQFLQSK